MDTNDKNLFKLPDNGYLEEPVVEVVPEAKAPIQESAQDIMKIARGEIRRLHHQLYGDDETLNVAQTPEVAETSIFQGKVIRRIEDLRAAQLRYDRDHEQPGILTSAAVRQLLHTVGVEIEPLSSEDALIEREKIASMSLFKKQQSRVSKASFYLGPDSRFHYAVEAVKAKKNDTPLLMLSYETHAQGTRKTIAEYNKINFVEKISDDELRRLNETIAGYYQNVTRDVYHAPAYLAPPHLANENNVREKINEQLANDEQPFVDAAKDDFDLAA